MWRIMFSRFAINDKRHMMGLYFPSYCYLCLQKVETLDNLFLYYDYAKCIQDCIGLVFTINMDYLISFQQLIVKVLSHWSSAQIASLLHAMVVTRTPTIWFACKQVCFQEVKLVHSLLYLLFGKQFSEANLLHYGVMANSISNRLVLHQLRVQGKLAKAYKFILVIWMALYLGRLKVNTNGAAS